MAESTMKEGLPRKSAHGGYASRVRRQERSYAENRSKTARWNTAPANVKSIWKEHMNKQWAAGHAAREEHRQAKEAARIAAGKAARLPVKPSVIVVRR